MVDRINFRIQGLITGLLLSLIVVGCNPEENSQAGDDTETATTPVAVSAGEDQTGELGNLQVRANGEDFVRQGFTAKDGWAITFDHVYVNLAAVTAYQTDPPFEPETGSELDPQQSIQLVAQQTVDLATGDETAEPILLAEAEAPAGRYNALSWQMPKASEGPAAGYNLVLVGQAQKDGVQIAFTIKLDEELAFQCGDFVGDQRKGILKGNDKADLEATFHFDHLFGDGDAAPDDGINTGALGFDPFAAIAQNGTVDVDMNQLQTTFSAENYALLQEILPGLAHTGEGHCETIDAS